MCRQTAAQIMQQAIHAATLAYSGDCIWRTIAYDLGTWRNGPRDRKMYDAIERGEYKVDHDFRQRHPAFAMAYDAIFGDSARIPPYQHYCKLVALARRPELINPDNWDKLPDRFEVLYQLSFVRCDLDELLANGMISKRTSIKAVIALRKRFDQFAKDQEERRHQEESLRELDLHIRNYVLSQLTTVWLAMMPESLYAAAEARIEKIKQEYLESHPLDHFDGLVADSATAELWATSGGTPYPNSEERQNVMSVARRGVSFSVTGSTFPDTPAVRNGEDHSSAQGPSHNPWHKKAGH